MSDEPEQNAGELFGNDLQTMADARLARRAIRARWPIKNSTRRKVMTELERIAETGERERDRVAATRAILQADQINADREERDQPKNGDININVNVAAAVRQEVLSDPAYLDYCRKLASDGDTGPVRQDDQSGQVANGKASHVPGSGANGHRNGKA